jgi:hypothetical protein
MVIHPGNLFVLKERVTQRRATFWGDFNTFSQFSGK